MTPLFSFSLSVPEGIELSVLLLFLLLGGINLWNLILHRRLGLVAPAALHVGGGVLAVLSADLITLLVSWELITITAFILIRHGGNNRSRQAALRYLIIQVIATVFFFIATVLQYRSTGTLATDILVSAAQPWITAAVLIKTASMPLHYWLIESYTAVSPGVATLLSGFATKVGVLTAARLVRFTPQDLPVLAYAGAGIAVIAVLFAVFQHNARRLLSYHIVSQVGYMTAGIGLAAASSAADHAAALAVTAGLFHLVSNTLYKSLLFMTAAAAYRSFGHENLLHMGGLARRRPVLFVCSLIGAGAIAGVPFTIGYASKELLKTAAGNTPIAIILTIAGIGTGVSFIKFIYLIFLAPGSTGAAPLHTGNSRTHRELLYMLPTVLLSAIVLVLGFAPGILPGIPTMDFFTLPAIGKATLPLAAAAGLWLLAKGHLTKPGRTGTKTEVESSRLQSPRTAWLTQHTWPLRHLARVVHALDPQIQMIVLLAAVTGLTLMLL